MIANAKVYNDRIGNRWKKRDRKRDRKRYTSGNGLDDPPSTAGSQDCYVGDGKLTANNAL